MNRKRLKLIGTILVAYLLIALYLLLWAPKAGRFILPLINIAFLLGSLVSGLRKKPELKAEEGMEEGAPARLTVLSSQRVNTGSDYGRLIECDGWLLFEGARTSFAVTRGEARRPKYDPPGHLRLEDDRTVVFAPIGGGLDHEPIKRVLQKWERASIPDGEAVLPPRETHPEIWADRWTVAVGAGIVLLLPFGMGLAFGVVWIWVLSLILISCAASYAWDYARRLKRELPRVLAADARALPGDPPLCEGEGAT